MADAASDVGNMMLAIMDMSAAVAAKKNDGDGDDTTTATTDRSLARKRRRENDDADESESVAKTPIGVAPNMRPERKKRKTDDGGDDEDRVKAEKHRRQFRKIEQPSEEENRRPKHADVPSKLSSFRMPTPTVDSSDDDDDDGESEKDECTEKNKGKKTGSGTSASSSADLGEKMVTVEPPCYRNVEKILGDNRTEDAYCYICDTVRRAGNTTLKEEVTRLLEYIPDAIYAQQDKVDVARKVLAMYEERIRKPANKKCGIGEREKVREWTLRGIYVHITSHLNDSDVVLDEALAITRRAIRCTERRKLYVAPPGAGSSSALEEDDLIPTKDGVAMLNTMLQKLITIVDKREKYHVSRSSTSGLGLSSRSSGGGSGHTVGNVGGRATKDGAVNLSALMGGDKIQSGTSRSARDTVVDRTSKRPFG